MNVDNLWAKMFREKDKPKQETPFTLGKTLQEKYRSSPQEVILESRDFEREGELLGGIIGDAQFVKIRDDGGGVFKPHTGYEGSTKTEFIARERAAYLISRFLGFDFVPPTVIKVVNGEEGSLQEFVEDAQVGSEVRDGDVLNEEMSKLAIFDSLIDNLDRHSGNYLVKGGRIFAIDHGYTFQSMANLEYGEMSEDHIPADLADKLRRFSSLQEQQDILRDLLGELLGSDIVDAFMKRVVSFGESIRPDNTFDHNKFDSLLRN